MAPTNCITYATHQKLLQRQGVAAKSAAAQKKFITKWAGWLLFITALALFYVWSRVQVVELGYELTAMKQQANELNKQISNLELEIGKLKSPLRLESIAKKELGMQPPAAEQIVLVRPEEGEGAGQDR